MIFSIFGSTAPRPRIEPPPMPEVFKTVEPIHKGSALGDSKE